MEISLGEYSTVLNLWTLSTVTVTVVLVFTCLYVRFLLQEMFKMSQFFIEVNNEIVSFSSHLKSIHELEMFYGDEYLGSLIKHSYHLVDIFENFGEVLGFGDDMVETSTETGEDEDGDFIDEEAEKEGRQTIPFQPQLFYGGTRKGDS